MTLKVLAVALLGILGLTAGLACGALFPLPRATTSTLASCCPLTAGIRHQIWRA
jgi:hypothetical protein